jgi:DNA polymerase III subunit gamma/tau
MSNANLNLARKWRSKNFDQIIGQELSVRMLKNSLYLNQFFPVYLFSGQRGCGKTTMARVFAAAINCERLADFRKNPKSCSIPCLNCASCTAMLSGKHPDFIEMDAASHTGVDNVRQIVDASQLLPLMGNKKIYLIDEAHMLSKAAFNAFLKILEEPPSSVLFILATTDPQKIIDTVKSRCFQLFFKPVSHDPLLGHLKTICDAEKITYEEAALGLIIKETEGSVRDALNVVEQVRFARGRITKESVLHVLGHIDDERMLQLLDVLLQGTPKDLLMLLQGELKFTLFSAEFVWNKLIEIIRAAIWLKYGVEPDWFSHYVHQLKDAVKICSVKRLNNILKLFYLNESLFLKTTAQHSLLEMILLQICQKNVGTGSSGSSPASQNAASPIAEDVEDDLEEEEEEVEEEEIEEEAKDATLWKQFLTSLDGLSDPLLSSIFKNGTSVHFEKEKNILTVEFAQQFDFFKETIDDTSHVWLPLLQNIFSDKVVFQPTFTGQMVVERRESKMTSEKQGAHAVDVQTSTQNGNNYNRDGRSSWSGRSSRRLSRDSSVKVMAGKQIDVSDPEIWKKANMIARYFSGSFHEISEA